MKILRPVLRLLTAVLLSLGLAATAQAQTCGVRGSATAAPATPKRAAGSSLRIDGLNWTTPLMSSRTTSVPLNPPWWLKQRICTSCR